MKNVLLLFITLSFNTCYPTQTKADNIQPDSLITMYKDTPLVEEPLTVSLDQLGQVKDSSSNMMNIYPSDHLYAGVWTNNRVHVYKNINVPSNYKIDLKGFVYPIKSNVVSSNFGYRPRFKRFHKGVDIKASIGDTIVSAFSGVVRVASYDANGYGNFVVVRHDNGLETIYGHMSKVLVKPNQEVKAGDVLGLAGNTGRSTGPHLHLETRFCGTAINPSDILNIQGRNTKGDTYEFKSDSPNVVH